MTRCKSAREQAAVILLIAATLTFSAALGSPQSQPASREELERAKLMVQLIPGIERELPLDYDNPLTHWNLGKAYVFKFLMQPTDAGNALGLALGEYVTSLDLQENPKVREELRLLYQQFRSIMGTGTLTFDDFYAGAKELYEAQKPNIRIVVDARLELETIHKRCPQAGQRALASEGTREHIHRIFLLSTGRELLRDAKTGSQVILAAGFYTKWREAIGSYGFAGTDRGNIGEVFHERLPADVTLIETGPDRGRFRRGREGATIIPGLRFFDCERP